MIAQPQPRTQPAQWQQRLALAVRDRDDLLARVGLDAAAFAAAHRLDGPDLPTAMEGAFPLRVPLEYLARMRHGDPHDPLLLQVLPRSLEAAQHEGSLLDPVGDGAAQVMPGLLHKYEGRVLLVLTGACAVHCRYCFRRDYPYSEAHAGPSRLAAALDWIAGHSDIREVILSGGDPLSLSDERLGALVQRLDEIPHLRRLRIHTRLPVVLPQRVDVGLLAWLSSTRLAKVVVLHVNHAQELDGAVAAACRSLRSTGAQLLNQAVLLSGVNDSVDAQADLSERLFECGVLPYYLHALDHARGVMHFEVGKAQALALMEALRARLPGYLVPRHVVEVAGAASKLEVR